MACRSLPQMLGLFGITVTVVGLLSPAVLVVGRGDEQQIHLCRSLLFQ